MRELQTNLSGPTKARASFYQRSTRHALKCTKVFLLTGRFGLQKAPLKISFVTFPLISILFDPFSLKQPSNRVLLGSDSAS